jgi:hypothetical protein
VQILLPDDISQATVYRIAILGGLLLELPLCGFGSFKLLSLFSFAGITSTVAVVCLVVALPLIDPRKEWLDEAPAHIVLGPGVIPATGIVAVRSCLDMLCLRIGSPALRTAAH